MTRIIYHPNYNITFFGLEKLHPFDSEKYGRVWQLLAEEFGERLSKYHVQPQRPIGRETLLAIHSATYLDQLRSSAYVAGALELPFVRFVPISMVDSAVLQPMRWATRGTVLAAREAISHGFAINLSGGYHHAKPNQGEGFCIYSDIALAVHDLRQRGQLNADDSVVYIDLDAHQGNGVCYAFFDDRRFFIFDMYNGSIYPAHDHKAQQRIDCNLPLPPNCQGQRYLDLLQKQLPPFLDTISRIGLAIYNAGTDVYEGDVLGGLRLSEADVLKRDLFVLNELRGRSIPTLMLLSGGYSQQSYQLVANTVRYCLHEGVS